MKRWMNWMIMPTLAALVGAIAPSAQADVATPLSSPVTRSGNVTVGATGAQSGACGLVPDQPVEVIRVTEPFASLQFTVGSDRNATLWITGNGQSQCLFADSFSDGLISLPGVWDAGAYDIYVGNRNPGSYAYELTIAP
ncbi:MAG TPA: hypothetical protein V6D20_06065 [Candidatus Obscuribacterales bacterium]